MIKSRKRGSQLARWVTWFLCRSPLGPVPLLEPALCKPAAINVSLQASEGKGSILKDVVLNSLCCTRVISLAFRTLKGKCQHSVSSNSHCRTLSWHPFKPVQRAHASKCCALWQRHHCCVLLKWEALVRLRDRKPSGKMLASVSLEPPTADGSNILKSLLSRWAKCFRPHKCWLERPCVCPHANMSTLPKQEIRGCCSNRIKVAREKSVEDKERLWKGKAQRTSWFLAFCGDGLKQNGRSDADLRS